MKKILVVILLVLGLLASCNCESPKREMPVEPVKELTETNYMPLEHANKFTYEGHSYIVFYSHVNMYKGFAGVVHDPDCECQKRD